MAATPTPPVETVAAAPLPLPEAPASVNCHITIAGRQVQVTLRDTDETRLLARLTALLAQYPLPEDLYGDPRTRGGLHGAPRRLVCDPPGADAAQ